MHQRLAIIVAALLALTACDRAGTPDGTTTAPATPVAPVAGVAAPSATPGGTPRISFPKTIHDFGVIADSQDYSTAFRFTNIGTGTLVISEVKATCGCTVPTLPKLEYAPGESATLNVRFDPSGKGGSQLQSVSVISNAKPNVVKLVIQADVRPLVQFNFFVKFGDIKLGQPHVRRSEMSYTDPDLVISDLFVTNPHVTATLVDVGRPNPAAGGLPYMATLEVKIDSDAPWGLLRDTQVKFTARGRAAEQFPAGTVLYTMWVNAQIYGDVRADPIVLMSMETLGRGQSFKVSSELTRASSAPFSVTGVEVTETSTPGLKPSVVANGPGIYTVSLEGTTPEGGGAVSGIVTVTTDVPGEESLSLQFAMYVK